MTRQQRRQEARQRAWAEFRSRNGLAVIHPVTGAFVPRRMRRLLAVEQTKAKG